jgi:recombination protein RecA
VGARTRLKVVKNKLAPPFRSAEVDMLYGRGISQESEIMERAEKAGVIARSGSWFAFGDERLGQGKDNVRDRLRAEPDLRARLVDALRTQVVAEAK